MTENRPCKLSFDHAFQRLLGINKNTEDYAAQQGLQFVNDLGSTGPAKSILFLVPSIFSCHMIVINIKPRVQIETFSLYWKESLDTKTTCFPEISLEIDENESFSLLQLMRLAAKKMGWQQVDTLSRLPGFVSPFERVLQRGQELDLNTKINMVDLAQPLVLVRIMLKADGWSIILKDDPFASDSEDNEN